MRPTIPIVALLASLALASCASKPKPGPVAPTQSAAVEEPSAPGAEPVQSAVRPGSQADLVASAGDRAYFDFDRYDLDSEARSTLQQQAAWLARNPNVKAIIAGNADERGTREYNLALGARRANAARQFLVSQGVDASRLQTVSYGKERPVDPRSNEEAWAKNRNAHTMVEEAVAESW